MANNLKLKSTLLNLRSNLKVILLFGFWYALNICYNITNKWALRNVQQLVLFMDSSIQLTNDNKVSGGNDEDAPISPIPSISSSLPITIGCLQFLTGSLYAIAIWSLGWRRPVPHSQELINISKTCWAKVKICFTTIVAPSTSTSTSASIPIKPASLTLKRTLQIATHHTLGQLLTVVSLSTNSISFTHVVKAMEPFFSALASRFILHTQMDIRVYLSLIPVVGGVVMACAGSNSFSWVSFGCGVGSNLFFGVRGVVSKMAIEEGKIQGQIQAQRKMSGANLQLARSLPPLPPLEFLNDEFNEGNGVLGDVNVQNIHLRHEQQCTSANSTSDGNEKHRLMEGKKDGTVYSKQSLQLIPPSAQSPANLFAAVTCASFLYSIPLALVFEGEIVYRLLTFCGNEERFNNFLQTQIHYNEIVANPNNDVNLPIQSNPFIHQTMICTIASGLFHYLNNEVMYLVLNDVHPITLAVGNTMKRVFIIVAGLLVFGTPVTRQTGLGSVIGIGGVFLYSVVKVRYDSSKG